MDEKIRYYIHPMRISQCQYGSHSRPTSAALMIRNGLPQEVHSYLLSCGWFVDFARYYFQMQPEELIPELIAEMLRSKAASWQDGYLVDGAPFKAPAKTWVNNRSSRKTGPGDPGAVKM